jgi:hypothetical protein
MIDVQPDLGVAAVGKVKSSGRGKLRSKQSGNVSSLRREADRRLFGELEGTRERNHAHRPWN